MMIKLIKRKERRRGVAGIKYIALSEGRVFSGVMPKVYHRKRLAREALVRKMEVA